jgi:hypothetical protein
MPVNALTIARYRELLLRAGLTDAEADFVIRRIREDMAELFGPDEVEESVDA